MYFNSLVNKLLEMFVFNNFNPSLYPNSLKTDRHKRQVQTVYLNNNVKLEQTITFEQISFIDQIQTKCNMVSVKKVNTKFTHPVSFQPSPYIVCLRQTSSSPWPHGSVHLIYQFRLLRLEGQLRPIGIRDNPLYKCLIYLIEFCLSTH